MKRSNVFILVTIGLILFLSSCDVVKKIVGFPDVDLNNLGNAKRSSDEVEYDKNDFFQVCAFGSERQVRSIIKQNPAIINGTDGYGFTPIFYAALSSNPRIFSEKFEGIMKALKTGDDDALYDLLETFPRASSKLNSVKTLLKNGARVDIQDDNGRSLFLYASIFSHDVDLLRELVKYGADVKERVTIQYPCSLLSLASFCNSSPEVIRYMAEQSGDINTSNEFGTTPIMWASMYSSNPKIIDTLVKCGANVNDSGHKNKYTPIIWAARCSRSNTVIEKLISLGADISQKDDKGLSAFSWAITTGDKDKIGFFIDELNCQVDFSTLKQTIENVKDKDTLQYLFSFFPNVNYRDESGETLLGFSVIRENVPAVKLLIEKGSDIDTPFGSTAQTALMRAVNTEKPNIEIVRTLINGGADVNVTTKDGISALIYSVNKNTTPDVARLLINAGAKKDATYKGDYVYEYCNAYIKDTSVYTELRNAVKSNSWWW